MLGAATANIPILGVGVNALVEHLTIGALLNTLVLSSLLTFPASVRHRLMENRGDGLKTPPVLSLEFQKEVIKTAATWTFWSRNLKSFGALLFVGAEIEGVMDYLGRVDAAIDPAFQAVTGQEFKLFETLGAAVERPEGDSPIPFGGAITWGNVLLYKAQTALGFNLSDAIANPLRSAFQSSPVAVNGADAGVAAAVPVVKAVTDGEPAQQVNLIGEKIAVLDERIEAGEARLDDLKDELDPVSDEERGAYIAALAELQEDRAEDYVESKLGEIHELTTADLTAERVKELQALLAYYDGQLPNATISPGYHDSIGVRLAMMRAADDQPGLSARIADLAEVQQKEWKLLSDMRRTIIDDLPPEVVGSFNRLDALRMEADQSRQALLDDTFANARSATELVMRDIALDAYLKDLSAYDAEVVKVFEQSEVKGSESAALLLNSIFSVRESIARQTGFESHGRALLALDALIDLQNAQLSAAQWSNSGVVVTARIEANLGEFESLRAKWYAMNPEGLEALYAVTSVDSEGVRDWNVQQWLSVSEVKTLVDAGKIRVEGSGDNAKLWYGDRELIGGVDVAKFNNSGVDAAIEKLEKSHRDLADLWDETFEDIWRIEQQDALVSQIERLQADLDAWREAVRLERERGQAIDPDFEKASWTWWAWIGSLLGMAFLGFGVWRWRRRGR